MTARARKAVAHRATLAERQVQYLDDRGIILATPATRSLGRGRPKRYDVREVAIAALLGPLVHLKAPAEVLGGVADFVRQNLGEYFGRARSEQIIVQTTFDPWGEWQCRIRSLPSNGTLPVTFDGKLPSMQVISSLTEAVSAAEYSVFDFVRQQYPPKEFLAQRPATNIETDLGKAHDPEEVAEFLYEAEQRAQAGIGWAEALPE